MAYNNVILFKGMAFKSKTEEDKTAYAILDKTCMYIRLQLKSIEAELEKVAGEPQGDVYIAKLKEIISKINTKPEDNLSLGRFGVIYFKTEENEVFPKLYVEPELCDFIHEHFPTPVLHLEGQIRLDGGSNAQAASKFKHFRKSWIFQKQMQSLTFASSFPVAMVQPINECQWILESFYLSIGWKDEACMEESIKSSSNQLLLTLFEGECPPKDFKLVAGNGAEIPFHGQIISAKSPALAAMVNPDGAMKEHESKLIEMMAFSEESLKAFIRYIYCQPVPLKEMDCDTVLELFRLGHMYQLPELAKTLSKMMLQKEEEWFSPNCALELYFFVKNVSEFKDLVDHTVALMLKMGDAVRESERYQELDKNEANELLWMLLKKSTSG